MTRFIRFIVNTWRVDRALLRGLRDPEFAALGALVIVILAVGSTFYHFVEEWRWLDSLFFSVTTLTTVGYGNLVPDTDAGKMFTIIYVFVGIGIILAFVNAIARHAKDTSAVTTFLSSDRTKPRE